MKKLVFFIAIFFITISFSSCTKDEPASKLNCEHLDSELQLRPFCNFAPANAPDVNFPIAVWYQGSPVDLEGFSFLWNDGNTASAVSVSYNSLPITVEITEESTGCVIEISLTNDFWG